MESKCQLTTVCILCSFILGSDSWLFNDLNEDAYQDDHSKSMDTETTSLNIRATPFEIITADDQFILEANLAKDLTALDACHHRVVSELEGRCGDLSEEELSKLSVHLFNCQAAVEKRPTYSCTSDMAISDCTQDMDSTTWNAYQIVSNRARAVCYSIRQQHFRARAEHTVNQLLSSSEQQLNRLASISLTQEQLKAIADNTIEKLETGHQQIAQDQQQLRHTHRIMNSQMLKNLQQIQHEKEIISVGNKQLLAKTEEIQHKLDTTAMQITEQSTVQSTQHKEILHDLAALGSKAEDVSSKLDASTSAAEKFHLSVIEYEQIAIENLKHINSTVNFLLSIFNTVHDSLGAKLEWIVFLISANNNSTEIALIVVTHISYAIVTVIFSSMLRVKSCTRCVLMLIIFSNAVAEVKFNYSFGFIELTVMLLAFSSCASLLSSCWVTFTHNSCVKADASEYKDNGCAPHSLSNEDIKYVIRALEQLSSNVTRKFSDSAVHENTEDFSLATSTPIRTKSQSHFEGSVEETGNRDFPLHRSPPRVSRHFLPATPSNPPPTPYLDGESLMHYGGAVRLSDIGTGHKSLSSSPFSTASCSSTPRKGQGIKAHAASLNRSRDRSFNRSVCTALTKTGQPCKLPAQEGSNQCYRHQIN